MSLSHTTIPPSTIIIFGASGDLTKRKLVPALHSLGCEGLLPDQLQVIGIARSDYTDQAFLERLYEGVVDYARLNPGICQLWSNFASCLSYLQK